MVDIIKIETQEGLVIFDQFVLAQIFLVHDTQQMHLEIRTEKHEFSESQLNELKQQYNKEISTKHSFVWLSINRYPFKLLNLKSKADLHNKEIVIEKGDDYGDGYDLSVMAYYGWGVRMDRNHIKFQMNGERVSIIWESGSDDTIYYDDRSKPAVYSIYKTLDLIEFATHELYWEHIKRRDNIK